MSLVELAVLSVLSTTSDMIRGTVSVSQRRMENETRRAQRDAAEEAQRRLAREQREQTRRINDSISQSNERIRSLEDSTRRNLEAIDRQHREQMTRLTQRVYEDIGTAQRQLSEKMDQQIEAVQGHVDQRIDAVQGQVDSLSRSVDQRFDAVRGQMSSLSRSVDQRFDAVQGQINTLTQGMQSMANEINQHFEQNEREMARMQSDIKGIVRDINQRYASEEEQARAAVETAQALMEVVEQRTPLDRFAPENEAQDLRGQMQNLTSSSVHGAALTAMAEAAKLKIWQVESHAIREKAKHDAMVEIALTQVERVLTIVNENREMEEPVEGGEPMKIENEFWSEGEYGRLEQELKNLKDELEDRYNRNLSKDRIEEITRRSAEIEARIREIAVESVRKAILSEARLETAEDIITGMREKGWRLKGEREKRPQISYMGGEKEEDWRQGVCAVLENSLGDEITVIVDPDTDTQNRLIIHQEPGQTGQTDKKVREQMQSIQAQMRDIGYQVGDSTASVTHIPQMGSVDRLRQAHATEQIRKQLQH